MDGWGNMEARKGERGMNVRREGKGSEESRKKESRGKMEKDWRGVVFLEGGRG